MATSSAMPAGKTERGALRAPCFVPPLLPTLVETPPAGEGWVHEIKHDGYRTQLVIERGKARAFSRNGHDWTDKYPRVASDAAKIRCRSAVLDGEVIVQDKHGRSDLEALYQAMADEPHRIVFFAFDLLHLDGRDLCPLPLIERKAMLTMLAGGARQCTCQSTSRATARLCSRRRNGCSWKASSRSVQAAATRAGAAASGRRRSA